MKRKLLMLPSRIARYMVARRFGLNPPLPFIITLSLSNRCASRCRTCGVWRFYLKNKGIVKKGELSAREWDKIIGSIGNSPIWVTLTGGEPFMRQDLTEIFRSICIRNKPLFVTIATSCQGYEPDQIHPLISAAERFDVNLIINLSVDEIGKRYDKIRGTKGGFRNVRKVVDELKKIKSRNLTIGANIVISHYNSKRIAGITDYLREELQPDSIVEEIASPRKAIYIDDSGIVPDKSEVLSAIEFLKMDKSRKTASSRIIGEFRNSYYSLVKRHLMENREVLPCYAGIASCEITYNGEVTNCAVLSESFGNLREYGYNFQEVWNSEKATLFRKRIKKEHCFCNLANACYTNRICNLALKI